MKSNRIIGGITHMIVNYFKCYSINLHKFLKANELQWISKGISHKTKNTYWLYRQDEQLSELQELWKTLKPPKKTE